MSKPLEQRSHTPRDSRSSFTFRAALLAFALLFFLAYHLPHWILWMRGGTGGGGYMPLIAVTAVILLIGLRVLPRPFRIAFSGGEIRSVFFVLAIGFGMLFALQCILAILSSPHYYDSPENNYRAYFLTEVPPELVPYDPGTAGTSDAVVRLYRGRSDVPWDVWIEPLAWWVALLTLIFGAQYCIGCLIRRQWLDNEKLMFPHAAMVNELLSEGESDRPSIYRDRLFWTGVGVSAFMLLLDGLNRYIPDVPTLGLHSLSLAPFFVEPPWDAMIPNLSFQPWLVAISYLLTTEITFSIWFFALFDNLMRAFADALTLPGHVRAAWLSFPLNSGSDTVGAVAVFVGVLIWTGREHVIRIVRRSVGLESDSADHERSELLSYRAAFWGFWFCAVGILIWASAVGLSVWYTALIFAIYALAIVFVSRVVAEIGLFSPENSWEPHTVALNITGYPGGEAAIGAMAGAAKPPLLKTLSVFSFMWAPLLTGPHMLPLILLGAKVTDDDFSSRRWLSRLTLLAFPIAMAIFAWRFLVSIYDGGALNSQVFWFQSHTWLFGNELVRDKLLRETAWSTNWTEVLFMGFGGLVMAFLLYMRRTFYWWPLHPIGYVATGINRGLWFSVLIGWSIKRAVLKYSGGEAFKRLTGFFVGLFFGQFAMAALWRIVGLLLGERGFTAGL